MSDFNSSLPVRTENNGDLVIKVADGTTATQLLNVDASGRVVVKLDDGAGNAITSQVNGVQRALDVGIDVAGVQIDPRAIRTLTTGDVVTAAQGTAAAIAAAWPVKPTDGTNSQAFLATGEAKVSVTQPLPAGTNIIGAIKLDDGAGNAVTSQANGSQRALDVGVNVAGVQIDPRSVRALTSADVVTANQGAPNTAANGWFSKITDGTNTAAVLATGEQKVSVTQPLPAGTNLLGQINIDVGGVLVSASNPIPVSITAALVGTTVNSYTTATVAAAGTSNHIYTVTATKTFQGKKIFASSSGKLKIEVQTSPDGTTYSSIFVGFNSTATPNIMIDMDELVFLSSGTGSTVRIIRTNLDKVSEDVYSTISGIEV